MDAHGCPACPHPGVGPAIVGSHDVMVNRRPALRVGDKGMHAACCGGNNWTAKSGAPGVFINGKAAFRMLDPTQHCGGLGRLIEGSPNVIVGDTCGGNQGSTHGGGTGGRPGGAGRGGAGTGGGSAAASGGGSVGPPVLASEPAVEPRTIRLHGVFKHGSRAIAETRFELRRHTANGPAVTPETLAGGHSENAYREGFWIADAGGSYLFDEMPAFTYFVVPELGVRGAPPPDEARDAPETCGHEGAEEGVIWVALFDDSMQQRLADVSYRIQLPDDRELTGTTDDAGELRHDQVATGMYTITVGSSEGNVPARPLRFAAAAYAVRICGAEAPS